jgi:hypothetical protein
MMCNQGSRPPIAGGIGEVSGVPADVTRVVIVDDRESPTGRTAVWLIDSNGSVETVGACPIDPATLAEMIATGELSGDGEAYIARPIREACAELTAIPPSRLRVAARRLCLLLHAATGVRA